MFSNALAVDLYCKFRKFHRKTRTLESLFIKEALTQSFSFDIHEMFKNTYFEEHLHTTDSEFFWI